MRSTSKKTVPKLKILIASLKAGGGHDALRDFLYTELKPVKSFAVSKFDHTDPGFEITNNLLPVHFPVLQDLIYHHSPRVVADMYMWGTLNLTHNCYEIVRKLKPDVIVATHFALAMHMALVRKLLGHKCLVISCLPDYSLSRTLFPGGKLIQPDRVMVFEEWTKLGIMKEFKLKSNEVILAGFNPRPEFMQLRTRFKSKAQALHQVRLHFSSNFYSAISQTKTTIIVSGGAGGYIQKTYPLLEAITRAQKLNPELQLHNQFFIICGHDQHTFYLLSQKHLSDPIWSNIFPFSWMDPKTYSMLQFASDFPILGSIAPATMNELLEAKCGPLLIYRTRPGQEVPHIAFIQEHGLGEYIPEAKDLLARLMQGISAAEIELFLKRGLAFRQEQSERAGKMSTQIRQAYAEFIATQNTKRASA